MSADAADRLQVRSASTADLPRVIAAADAIFRTPAAEGLHSMGIDYPLLFAPENVGQLFLVEDDRGEVVAHAGFVLRAAWSHGIEVPVALIGAVFTAPAHRKQGLATRVFAAAAAHAQRAGAALAMVSGRRGLYERAGFVPYPACPRHHVPAAASTDTVAIAVAPYRDEDLPHMMALAEPEPVRFARTPDDWRRLLGAKVLFFEPAEVFVMWRADKAVGYVAVGRPRPSGIDPLAPRTRTARVLELAGDRAAVAEAAPAVARTLDVDVLEIIMPPADQSLVSEAAARSWHSDQVRFPFAVAWWDAGRRELPLPFYGFNYV